MSEEVITFGSTRTLVGILHRPESEVAARGAPAVLLLNAGLLHRVGPNRLYVRIARDLERRGFHVLRFDVWGIGDSQDHEGPQDHKTFVDDTLEAFDFLRQRTGVNRFMLMGICMGAQIALEVAGRDERVDSLVLMEGIYVKSARYYVSRMLDPDKWKRLLLGRSHLAIQVRKQIVKRLEVLRGNSRAEGERSTGERSNGFGAGRVNLTSFLDRNRTKNMRETLRSLLDRGTRVMLVFRDGNEIVYNYRVRRSADDIVAVDVPPGMSVVFVPFADHTFTPLLSQDLLVGTTLKWIEGVHAAHKVGG